MDPIEELTQELNGVEDTQAPDTEQPETDSQVEDNEQDDGQEADDEAEDLSDDSQEDEEEGEQPETDSLDGKEVKWKTGSGEAFTATVAELKQGYMRTQDYTQKTQELAKTREQANLQLQQQYSQVEQYASELGQMQIQNAYINQLEQQIQHTSRADDPVAYQGAVSELLMAQRTRDGLAARISQVQQGRTAEQQQAFIAAQQQAAAALTTGPQALPNFGKELVQKMNETGHEYGLSDQDLATITDPRHIRILHDAMKYRELQAKRPEAIKKASQAKPSRQTRSAPSSRIEKVAKSFDANPSIEAMAALMSANK